MYNVFGPHQNEKPEFSNPSGLKSAYHKLRFFDRLLQTAGLTIEIKRRFLIISGILWTVVVVTIGTFRLEDEDDYEYGFSVLSMRIRFGGRHFSKCPILVPRGRDPFGQ